jgi:hypothetical protein
MGHSPAARAAKLLKRAADALRRHAPAAPIHFDKADQTCDDLALECEIAAAGLVRGGQAEVASGASQ